MLDHGLSTDDLRRRLDSYLGSHTVSLDEIEAIGQKVGFRIDDDQAKVIDQLDPFRQRYVDLEAYAKGVIKMMDKCGVS